MREAGASVEEGAALEFAGSEPHAMRRERGAASRFRGVRVVLDPNVLVSALISSGGPPRHGVAAWVQGRFELVTSPLLLGELGDVLARHRFRRRAGVELVSEFIASLENAALVVDDPPARPVSQRTPDDDYLVTLARELRADFLVSGDTASQGRRAESALRLFRRGRCVNRLPATTGCVTTPSSTNCTTFPRR